MNKVVGIVLIVLFLWLISPVLIPVILFLLWVAMCILAGLLEVAIVYTVIYFSLRFFRGWRC